MTIQIKDLYDHRNQPINVGDLVAYPAPVVITSKSTGTFGELLIQAKPSYLKFSRVRSIVGDDYGGFAEAGRRIVVTFEDGHTVEGDSENGGFNILKLSSFA